MKSIKFGGSLGLVIVLLIVMHRSNPEAAAIQETSSTVLARIDFSGLEGRDAGFFDSLAFVFRAFVYPDEVPSGAWIVGPLSAADIGRTFLGDASTASQYFLLEFQTLAELLADGENNIIEFGVRPFPSVGGSIGTFETSLFGHLVPELRAQAFVPLFSGFDLSGYQIEALTMKINDALIFYDEFTNSTSSRGAYTIEVLGRPLEGRVVDVDIKPESLSNTINLRAPGNIPVAILTSATFDATTVDTSSVCFGDAETASERDCSIARGTDRQDIDGDGDLDLVLRFGTGATGIDANDPTACLTGRTSDGTLILGCDVVRAVPRLMGAF